MAFIAREGDGPGKRFAALGIVERRFFPDLHEDILQHIFRGSGLFKTRYAVEKRTPEKPLVELLETLPVALSGALEKLDLDLQISTWFGVHV
jgi:hypothetical protein